MQTDRTTKQTAAQRYTERTAEITTQLAELQALLAEHAQRQASDAGNWGYVGDLARISECLNQALGRGN